MGGMSPATRALGAPLLALAILAAEGPGALAAIPVQPAYVFRVTIAHEQVDVGASDAITVVATTAAGVIAPDIPVMLSVDGAASVSPSVVTTNAQGQARAAVTDALSETVTVQAFAQNVVPGDARIVFDSSVVKKPSGTPSAGSLSIVTSSLSSGATGAPYSAILTAAGGDPPYVWAIMGSLPQGLSLTSGDTITGTPTAAGTSSFVVQVEDSSVPPQTRSVRFHLRIVPGAAAAPSSASPRGGNTINPSQSATPVFSDVPSGYWAARDIALLAASHVITGFPNGTFAPTVPVTRAEFVKMLTSVLRLPPSEGSTPFADVPSSAWYAPYVGAAVAAGLVTGVTPTAFGPNDPVTREEMAVMLARAFKLKHTTHLTFVDGEQIAPWALPSVEAVVAAGYVEGFPNGSFQPLAPMTRADAAKVLAVALERGA